MNGTLISGARIAAIQLVCRDVAATAAFYRAAFGRTSSPPPNLMLGEQSIELVPTKSASRILAPANSTAFQHFAIVVSDIDKAMQKLSGCQGWSPISRAGPQALPPASGGVTAFKFRDPEGHPLELLRFPDDARPPAWSDSRPGTFLGIDHSAITVANTARSVVFYQELGFIVLSRQVNRGPEQGRLDDLNGAVVEVTSLASPTSAAPHLELLCYQNPSVIAEVAAMDDPRSTRLILESGDCDRGTNQAKRSASIADETCMRDPDGHVLALIAATADS
jgi:catechol 2,3-dioxygenase-like lactoylglutathione lyase family enzyme